MYNAGEKEFAYELLQMGSISAANQITILLAPDGVPYTLILAQVIWFLAVLNDMPQVETNLRRACDYINAKRLKGNTYSIL
jgi:hypothetical protein